MMGGGKTFGKGVHETSLAELYLEMDRIHWAWKLLCSVANWLMLAGFIVLPSAFDEDDSKFRLSQTALRYSAVVLLILGYLTTGFLCWRFKNPLFQLEGVFMPGFTSSALGMMSSLFSVYGKVYDAGESQWGGTAITAVTLSAVFMLLYGTTAMSADRAIARIREHDRLMEELVQNAYEEEARIPEAEKVRRQLLELMGVHSAGGRKCVCGADAVGKDGGGGGGLAPQGMVVDGAGIEFSTFVVVQDPEAEARGRERERGRVEREREGRGDEEQGLGLPAALRRGSIPVQMSATVGRVDGLWDPPV
ncbi:hypothetical protein EDC01DRAFT_789363 [Geopyxis carbonaria]|nr:hypothetical protein EDC01DRAFT_789363 [Geopyxis carbonaria]